MAEKICPKCKHPNRVTARFCAVCGAPLLDGIAELQAQPTAPYSAPADPPPILPTDQEPMLIGRYRLEDELGRGGFGAVYRAWDANLDRRCAVKENTDPSPDASRQFGREASILANLSHPNLPRVIDHFIIPAKGQYLVMDFVEGDDLESLLEHEHHLPLDQALFWVYQVIDALQYLHEQDHPVIHRDIKPANIRITPQGRAILVDFGLVKVYDPNQFTTLGARAVTPGFAPPEQYGKGKTDSRTDIYALAATLYNMLTGEEPLESVQRVMGEKIPPAHHLNPTIPAAVAAVIEKAMALDPAGRFPSVVEFKHALQAAASGQVDAAGFLAPHIVSGGLLAPANRRPGSSPRRVSRPHSKTTPLWLPMTGLAGIMVAFVMFAIGMYIFSFNNPRNAARITATVAAQKTLAARLAATSTAQAALLSNLSDTHSAPTSASTSGLAAISGLPQWPVRFADDFNHSEIAFWIGEDFANPHFSRIVTSQKPGSYQIEIDPLDSHAYWFVHNPDLRTDDEFILSADVRPDPTSPASLVGIVFRLIDEGQAFYWFGVDSQGRFSVWLHQKDESTNLLPTTASGQDLSGLLRLTVYAQQSHFTFYINQTQVAGVDDPILTQGIGGIYVESGSPEAATFKIDSIQLQSP